MQHGSFLPLHSCRKLGAVIALPLLAASASAFSPVSLQISRRVQQAHRPTSLTAPALPGISRTSSKQPQLTNLFQSNIDITTPTPDEAAELGARDWPQQFKTAPGWSEQIADEQVATRYILSGTGSVSISSSSSSKSGRVGPGTLVEITGPVQVDWTIDGGDGGEMIVLTPGYEETGLLLGVAAAFVVLCGVLVATAGGQ